MYNYFNSSVIYVSQTQGDDWRYNGFTPQADEYGNGPYKTIEKALASVGERRVAGFMRPMTIALTDDYFLDKTITMNCDKKAHIHNLALSGVTIESYGRRRKVIGGIKISDWKKDVFCGRECISSQLPQKADATKWDFVDLFVNGKRAFNTRYPAEGTLKALATEHDYKVGEVPPLFDSSTWFIAIKEDLEKIEGIEDAIVNFNHYWVDEHTPVKSYDRKTGKLELMYKSRFTMSTLYGDSSEHTSAFKYYLENVPTMFRNENEWYLDRSEGKVYYIPENMEMDLDTIEAYAPTLDKLFEICGNDKERVKDIRIRDLELLCTSSNYISKKKIKDGEVISVDDGFASDTQSACFAHGAICFEKADRCCISDCLISHIGTYAVEIKTFCKGIRIENNIMDDLGAGGVKIFGNKAKWNRFPYTQPTLNTSGQAEDESTSDCIIRGNRITNCGKKLAAGCGVLLCHASNNEISDNEIAYLEYSGISVGWEWGYYESTSYGNLITNNHVHHVGQGNLSDMGGIYLLGKQQGTIVSNNRVHDVWSAHYGGFGIYTDEGTSYVTIENNVVYNTKSDSFHQHYGFYNVVKNNIFAFGCGSVLVATQGMHDGVLFENNIFVTDDNAIYRNYNAASCIAKKNLIFDVSKKQPVLYCDAERREWDFESWTKQFGKDMGSIVADPLFRDIRNYDFTISDNSPAVSLGFKPIKGFPAVEK